MILFVFCGSTKKKEMEIYNYEGLRKTKHEEGD